MTGLKSEAMLTANDTHAAPSNPLDGWMSSGPAARMLHISQTSLGKLAIQEHLPFIVDPLGNRLYEGQAIESMVRLRASLGRRRRAGSHEGVAGTVADERIATAGPEGDAEPVKTSRAVDGGTVGRRSPRGGSALG